MNAQAIKEDSLSKHLPFFSYVSSPSDDARICKKEYFGITKINDVDRERFKKEKKDQEKEWDDGWGINATIKGVQDRLQSLSPTHVRLRHLLEEAQNELKYMSSTAQGVRIKAVEFLGARGVKRAISDQEQMEEKKSVADKKEEKWERTIRKAQKKAQGHDDGCSGFWSQKQVRDSTQELLDTMRTERLPEQMHVFYNNLSSTQRDMGMLDRRSYHMLNK
ncbi:hypothetical protein AGMMS49531_05490 [Endomicrobiia bacterium]|nr:hypothetical protein AGMMS49531_05490 [Endomicrobiia bacterium]